MKEQSGAYSMENNKHQNGSRPSTPVTRSIDEESQTSHDRGEQPVGIKYMVSLIGIIRVISMILCLIAFICVEASKACSKNDFFCSSSTKDIYIFFATVTLASFLTSIALFVFISVGFINKIKVAQLTKNLAEIAYISVVVFFLLIADIFFSVKIINVGSLHAAAVFGYLALVVYVVHLVIMIYKLRKCKPNVEGGNIESSKEEDNYSWTPGGTTNSQTDTLPQLQFIRPRANSIESDKLPSSIPMVEVDLESEELANKTFLIDDKSDEDSHSSSRSSVASNNESKDTHNTYTICVDEILDQRNVAQTKADFENTIEDISDSSSSSSSSSKKKKKKNKNKYEISSIS